MRFANVILLTLATIAGVMVCMLIALRLSGDIHAYRVPTGGMSPTLIPGDMFIVEGLSYRLGKPARGDVAVFTTSGIAMITQPENRPSPVYIQRIVGVPGDKIAVRQGELFINGEKTTEIPSMGSASADAFSSGDHEVVVPAESYFLLGDNRRNSFDSRYWGFLPGKNIRGRAFFRYAPADRLGAIH